MQVVIWGVVIKQGEKHSCSICDSEFKPTTASDWETEEDHVKLSFPPLSLRFVLYFLFLLSFYFSFIFFIVSFFHFFLFSPFLLSFPGFHTFPLSFFPFFFLVAFLSLFQTRCEVLGTELGEKVLIRSKCTTYAVIFDIWDQYQKSAGRADHFMECGSLSLGLSALLLPHRVGSRLCLISTLRRYH